MRPQPCPRSLCPNTASTQTGLLPQSSTLSGLSLSIMLLFKGSMTPFPGHWQEAGPEGQVLLMLALQQGMQHFKWRLTPPSEAAKQVPTPLFCQGPNILHLLAVSSLEVLKI